MKNFFWILTLVSIGLTTLYTVMSRMSEANRDFR